LRPGEKPLRHKQHQQKKPQGQFMVHSSLKKKYLIASLIWFWSNKQSNCCRNFVLAQK